MQSNEFDNTTNIRKDDMPITKVLQDVGTTFKDLVQSEVTLIKAEMKDSLGHAAKHSVQGAVFGAILGISVLPFLAFLVIGLGRMLDGNYWLSSLIVAVFCAAVGGLCAYRAFKKLKDEDLTFQHTKDTLGVTTEVISDKTKEVRETTSAKMDKAKKKAKGRAA